MINQELKKHKLANKKLDLIRGRTAEFIRKNINHITEREACEFVISEFKRENIVIGRNEPRNFVVTNKHTDDTHWNLPMEKLNLIIKSNDLIVIDIWGRLNEKNSPFADITWVFYTGKNVPTKMKELFDKVISARDLALDFIRKDLKKKKLSEVKKVDKAVRDYFKTFRMDKCFTHITGHSLGHSNCHGKFFKFSKTSRKKIIPNVFFTIEPGLYLKGEFGARSEIDAYVTDDYKLIITSSVQNEIIKIF